VKIVVVAVDTNTN